jgi:hypothetical protein
MGSLKGRQILFYVSFLLGLPLIHAQDYQFDLLQTESGVFYTDTLVNDSSTTLQRAKIVDYAKQKYQTKNLPITYKDSTAIYVMSYTAMSRKTTLWFTAKFQKERDSVKVILFQFEIQDPEEYNTPTPAKVPLEEMYSKYLKNKKPGTKAAYHAVFTEIQDTIFRLKKELAPLVSKP